jgi:predicted metal-dependent hydrolase
MLDQVNIKVSDAKTKLNKIINPDPNIMLLTIQLNKSIDDAVTFVKEQLEWLKIYFSKGKSGRKLMFYEKKITWFGIPIK